MREVTKRSRPSSASRSWFRLRLRSLIVLVTVLCLGTSWLAGLKRSGDRQRQIVDEIYRTGGWVAYDYQLPTDRDALFGYGDPRNWCDASQAGPWWLRRELGDDAFRNVVAVCASSDFKVSTLLELRHLRRLKLSTGRVTYGCVEPANRSYADVDFTVVGKLGQLQALDLSDSRVNDFQFGRLKNLSELEYLDLSDTEVTDESLRVVGGMPKLRYLNLERTYTTDAGIARIAHLRQIEALRLDYTEITSTALEALKGTKSLKELSLWTTGVPDEDSEAFQKAMPTCNVDFGWE
jgi:Leucine rich repeat